MLLSIYIALAFAGIGAWLAIQTGSPEAVQGMFPLLFVLFFLSTMNLPADFIEKDWFRTIAELNPISFLIDGMRGLILDGWDMSTLLPCIAVATAILRRLLRPGRARPAQAGAEDLDVRTDACGHHRVASNIGALPA